METMRDVFDGWAAYRQSLADLGSIAPSTLANQTRIVAVLAGELGQEPIANLRKSHVDLFVAKRRQTCAPVTIAGEIDVLRQVLNWAVDEKLLKDRPRLPSVEVLDVEEDLPSDDAYAWYLRTLSDRHGDALQFMLLTGLSPHEMERMTAQDVDYVSREALIGFRPDFRVKTASRRRRVPLNNTAWTLWLKATTGLAQAAAVWPRRDALQKAMRRHFLARDDAPEGTDGLTPKMMRKWFASKIAHGHSEAMLQRLLGHKPGSPVTRKHYVRTQAADLRGAVDTLG